MCIQHSDFQGAHRGIGFFFAWLSTCETGIPWTPGDHREQKRIKQKRISNFWQHQKTCDTIDTRGTKRLQAPGKKLTNLSNWQPQERFERPPESLAMLVSEDLSCTKPDYKEWERQLCFQICKAQHKPRQRIKKQRYHFAKKLWCQCYGFSSSHVWMWELDQNEG